MEAVEDPEPIIILDPAQEELGKYDRTNPQLEFHVKFVIGIFQI